MKAYWLLDIFLFLLGLCFNIVLMAGLVYLVYFYTLEGYAFGSGFSKKITDRKQSLEVELVLEEDTPVAEAARMLEELGVIGNRYVYQLEMFLKDSSKIYKAGTYTLNQDMNNTRVNITLRAQPEEDIPDNIITILEGWSLRDTAMYLEDRELVGSAEFLEACQTLVFPFSFVYAIPERANRLEGYLFPDTYFVSPKPTPYEIIYKMLSRFDEIFSDEFRYRVKELDTTIDDIVIIASMVEKEVRMASERPVVAQVIYNRLRMGYPLQIDATIQYALDKRRDRLLLVDLTVDSPYNTYENMGLPIGPISSPGEDCLRAALYPEDGNYVYYVLQDEETGEHFFTHDYDAFLNAKERYKK